MTATTGDGSAGEVPGAAGAPAGGPVTDPAVQPPWTADDVPNTPPGPPPGSGTPLPGTEGPRSPEAREEAVAWASWWQPQLPLDGRPRRAWREQVRLGAAEMSRLAGWMGGRSERLSTPATGLLADADSDAAIRGLLQTADDAARGVSFWPAARRARMERAFGALDAAGTALLRRAPDCYLKGQQSALRSHATAHLPPEHPQRKELLELDLLGMAGPLGDVEREVLASANRTASRAARREHARLRSFQAIIVLTTVALLVLAVAIALLSAARPTWMPLCFAPAGADAVVCPTGAAELPAGTDDAPPSVPAVSGAIGRTAAAPDAALVMLLGLTAAAVTGTVALRRMRGTSTPFAVPMALLALKLPTGALTAFLGLLLIHGQIVPGLSALDTSGQILAWALLFGAAQQLVTGLVDKKAQTVLDSVGPAPMRAEQE